MFIKVLIMWRFNMNFKYRLFIFVLLFTFGSSLNAQQSKAEINYEMFKINSFLWGQTVSCFIRLETYSQVTTAANAENENLNFFPIDEQLKTIIGDVSSYREAMWSDKAFDPSFVNNEFVSSRENYEELIRNIALEEWQSGTAWLQSMGCYKMFKVYGFVK